MQIGTLSALTGLSRDSLRFYEKRGLLQARRAANGYRDYPEEAVQWLGYVRTAQQLGFTLAEIAADPAVPITRAPSAFAQPLRICPTPPAAACTSTVSPGFTA